MAAIKGRATARIAEAHYITGMYDPHDMSNVSARLSLWLHYRTRR